MKKIVIVGDIAQEEKQKYIKKYGENISFAKEFNIEPGCEYIGASAVLGDVTIQGNIEVIEEPKPCPECMKVINEEKQTKEEL